MVSGKTRAVQLATAEEVVLDSLYVGTGHLGEAVLKW
jgi:hypothetical protein